MCILWGCVGGLEARVEGVDGAFGIALVLGCGLLVVDDVVYVASGLGEDRRRSILEYYHHPRYYW